MTDQTAGTPGTSLDDDFYAEESWMTEGEWVSKPGAAWGFRIVYCGPLNRDVQRAVAEIYIANQDNIRQDENGQMVADEALEHDMTLNFLIEHAVKGWRGITDEDGKNRKFTKTALRAELTRLPALVDWLWRRCQQKSYFAAHVEAAAKN